MKSLLTITDLAEFQSVFSPSKIQTASRTIITIGDGFMKPLTSAISALLIFYKASSASLIAGNALFNSLYASSAINLISNAY